MHSDDDILDQIKALVDEEHALERGSGTQGPSTVRLDRLRELEVALDQCWDLLRQRRARRKAGQDPRLAAVRPQSVVEGYQQ